MFVGSDFLSKHDQRRISVAYSQIPENLIVASVFLNDVDDVLDGVSTCTKRNLVGVAAH